MWSPIAAVLVLFVVQTLLGPTFRYLLAGPGVGERLGVALGPRDAAPPPTVWSGRADRALANLQEALPVFLTVALLHEIHGTDREAVPWAYGFFAARFVYVPAYLSGVAGLRSAVWCLSWQA